MDEEAPSRAGPECWASHVRAPTTAFSPRQKAWILLQVFASTGICWGVNYGISIAVYKGVPPPTLWQFPLPLAGHFGVLCIVETLINWVIVGSLQAIDLKSGLVEPLHPSTLRNWWPSTENKITWWLCLSDLVIPPEKIEDRLMSRRIPLTLLRSTPWMLFVFVLVFPTYCLVTYTLWGDRGYNAFPLPQYITATFGGLIAFVTIPFWSLISLVYVGRRVSSNERAMTTELTSEVNMLMSANRSPRGLRNSPRSQLTKGVSKDTSDLKFVAPRSPDSPLTGHRKINII